MDRIYSLSGQLFRWNTDKAASNLHKHGVAFEEAASVFLDEAATLFDDADHSVGENRFVILGQSYLRRTCSRCSWSEAMN